MAAPVGNQNARKGRIWTEALKRALARREGSVDAGLDKLADEHIAAAFAGDEKAKAEIRERIGDRLEGKPAQQVQLSGDPENPLQTVNRVELVDLK